MTRPRFLMVVALFLLASQAIAAQSVTLTGKVIRVADGDTLTLLVDKTEHRIRLASIDAPEKGQAFGNKSKQALTELAQGRTASVEVSSQDRYGRDIGVVTIDGVNVNRRQVETGLAWWYRHYAPDDKDLAETEKQSREAKRGLWADAHPVEPWEWRKEHSGKRTGK